METNGSNTKSAAIPIIDLNSANAAAELLDAAATFGFVFVRHQGLNLAPEQVDDLFQLSRRFFSSSTHVKAECTINSASSGKNHGWLSMHTETLDPKNQKKGDFKEAFNIGEYVNGKPQQPLPAPLKVEQDLIGNFLRDCHDLCDRILKLFAIALEIPSSAGGEEWFSQRHDISRSPSGSVLRLLYYPSLPDGFSGDTSEDIRAGAHSDYGSITLLFRLPSQPGLEILTPEGEWATVPVDPEPGSDSKNLPILVNIGDLLSYWTNGLLKSTVHRVIFPKAGEGRPGGEDRYSIAYFCHPEDAAELVEIPSRVVREKGHGSGSIPMSDKKVLTARDHLNDRLAATYGI